MHGSNRTRALRKARIFWQLFPQAVYNQLMRDIRPSNRKRTVRREAPPPEIKSVFTKAQLIGRDVPIASLHPEMVKKNIKPAADLFVKHRPKKRNTHLGQREKVIVLTLLALTVLVGLIGLLLFLPKADIKISLRTVPLLIDEKLTLRAADASDAKIIPGTSFTRETNVTGKILVASTEVIGTKSHGTVQIVNRTLSVQKIKDKSRLVTKDGQLFYLQGSVNVPAASTNSLASAEAQIEAAEAGVAGNIAPQRLDFAALDKDSQQLVYAETKQAFASGTGDTVAVVKDSDIEAAKKAAGQTARQQVEQDIRSQLSNGWAFLDESWTADLTKFNADVKAEDRKPEINYTAHVTVRVMGYEMAALENHLRQALNERLDENYMLFPGPISYSKKIDDVNWDTSEAKVGVRVTHTTIPKISLDTLKQKIAGRSQTEAQLYLEGLPGVRAVTMKLWPFWVNSIPRIEKRIMLDLQSERQP